MLLRTCICLLAAGMSIAQGARRTVSIIVTGGTVLTMDRSGRILAPGAVAIAGRDLVAVDTARADAAQFDAPDILDAAGHVVMPGLINTHARADGPLPRPCRRPRVDGVAPKVHLSRRGEDRHTAVRPRGDAAGRSRDDSGRDDEYADTYYFEEEIGTLEPGTRADLIVVSLAAAHQTPLYDPLSHLVYATRGDDVRTTIVNGRVLMRDGRVLSIDAWAAIAEARAVAATVRTAVTQ